ncbi:MAG: cytochrome c/FTR1 family iron permease [Gammaproteobacteria bacterium]|nr:MAG: cytochrome c/FTR1 family iron permease [Gammaproteobacteria bacterium]
MNRLLVFLLLFLVASLSRAGDAQQLLQLIDYVGVDYAEAVADGVVTNAAEYTEMQDFTAGIQQQLGDLPDSAQKSTLLEQGEQLNTLVRNKSAALEVNQLTTAMRLAIIDSYKVTVVPRKQPDLIHAAALYEEQCAGCHGVTGDGRGPQAAGLDPAPINFRDIARYSQRTLYGLYNTITQGVPNTSMSSYHALSADDRWSLAFYVGQFAVSEPELIGVPAQPSSGRQKALMDITKLTVTTPAEAIEAYGPEGGVLMAQLRRNPVPLFSKQSPLQFSRHQLDDVVTAYAAHRRKEAYRLAVEAYLEGFELVEQGLNAVDSELRIEIEQAMTGLRTDIRNAVPVKDLEVTVIRIKGMLDVASDRLSGRNLSGGAAFASAFFILVREGLEALLVVAALAAFLVKTEHPNAMRYLHYGWVGALAVGFLTWLASVSLIEISGASREITEGVAALLATAVLFYVGFWLHDKTNAAQWKSFIEDNVRKALSAGTLWGLAGLSFIAVFREVFETILFYQALWVQTDEAGKSMALSGFGAGVAVLAILAWIIMRYSARLPLRQFFSVTGILMFVLALVFAGKGVAALQEAGYIPVSPINFPRIDLLGIYPNIQGLSLQLGLLLLALFLWYGLPGKRRTA